MIYTTWYEFKKDFEKQLGHNLLNWDWLAVKPRAPLPWDGSQMRAALSAVARSKRAQGGKKGTRDGLSISTGRRVDRDVMGRLSASGGQQNP